MEENNKSVITRRMFLKGVSLSFGTLPFFMWPRWAQAFYYNLGLFKGNGSTTPYIEDIFSTYCYTGTGSSLVVSNGINLSGSGGMVWIKNRGAVASHTIFDTTRGVNNVIYTNATTAQSTQAGTLTAFNSDGFTLGNATAANTSANSYASFSFRKAAKFFDIVTYTGNGSTQNIPHSLGAAVGMIIVKRVDTTQGWAAWHRSGSSGNYFNFEQTSVQNTATVIFGNNTAAVDPTSTQFTVGTGINANGGSYVAYLFAHDAEASGLIQCGTFTASGSLDTVSLGWEPQLILTKCANVASDWVLTDNVRGFSHNGLQYVASNSGNAEVTSGTSIVPTGDGFTHAAGSLYSSTNKVIYLAIRRGPMRVPTDATKVYQNVAVAAGAAAAPAFDYYDMVFSMRRNAALSKKIADRLRGVPEVGASGKLMWLSEQNSETTYTGYNTVDNSGGQNLFYKLNNGIGATLNNTTGGVAHFFKRAPGFFDIVCYNVPASGATLIRHSLGVVPELVIFKNRNSSSEWPVFVKAGANGVNYIGPSGSTNFTLTSSAASVANYGPNPTDLTSTTFGPSFCADQPQAVGDPVLTYLFASCPGVSKVGGYTGNGTSQTINCNFTSGARFILIKRTDATGEWYTWDSARGIVAGNDPFQTLSFTGTENTATDSIDPDNSGFIVNQVAATNINVNAATYMFLAIA